MNGKGNVIQVDFRSDGAKLGAALAAHETRIYALEQAALTPVVEEPGDVYTFKDHDGDDTQFTIRKSDSVLWFEIENPEGSGGRIARLNKEQALRIQAMLNAAIASTFD